MNNQLNILCAETEDACFGKKKRKNDKRVLHYSLATPSDIPIIE